MVKHFGHKNYRITMFKQPLSKKVHQMKVQTKDTISLTDTGSAIYCRYQVIRQVSIYNVEHCNGN